MPYTSIKNRRLAWKRWSSKHKAKRRFLVKIQHQAIYAYPKRQVCSIAGCHNLGERHHPDYLKPKDIVWFCKTHHEEQHHKDFRKCSYVNCERKHWAKGFCHMHLKRTNRIKYA